MFDDRNTDRAKQREKEQGAQEHSERERLQSTYGVNRQFRGGL